MKLSQVRDSRKRVAQAYAQFQPEDLTIRDLLALDRTTLANERTFLSYVRTALGLAAAGGALIKISPGNVPMLIIGFLLLVAGVLAFWYGYRRFLRTRKALLMLNEPSQSSESAN